LNCIAGWKIGNIGNIVVNQQLGRQQTGNRPATFQPAPLEPANNRPKPGETDIIRRKATETDPTMPFTRKRHGLRWEGLPPRRFSPDFEP
jgi:hypothetical protein